MHKIPVHVSFQDFKKKREVLFNTFFIKKNSLIFFESFFSNEKVNTTSLHRLSEIPAIDFDWEGQYLYQVIIFKKKKKKKKRGLDVKQY